VLKPIGFNIHLTAVGPRLQLKSFILTISPAGAGLLQQQQKSLKKAMAINLKKQE